MHKCSDMLSVYMTLACVTVMEKWCAQRAMHDCLKIFFMRRFSAPQSQGGGRVAKAKHEESHGGAGVPRDTESSWQWFFPVLAKQWLLLKHLFTYAAED